MDETKIKTIPRDAMIDVTISGAFYERLQNCLFTLVNQNKATPEELVIIFKELETRQPKNFWESQVITYLALLVTLDEAANKQKLSKEEALSKYITSPDISPGASPEN